MEVIISILAFIKDLAPAYITGAIAFVVLVFSLYTASKKVNVDAVTSISSSQAQTMESLLKQIKVLSEELSKARTELTELHTQLMDMRNINIKLTKRLEELELRFNPSTNNL